MYRGRPGGRILYNCLVEIGTNFNIHICRHIYTSVYIHVYIHIYKYLDIIYIYIIYIYNIYIHTPGIGIPQGDFVTMLLLPFDAPLILLDLPWH